jgi:hypothetical protein
MTKAAKTIPGIVWWPVTSLTPYELNAKKHDKAQVSRLVTAIQRYGWPDANAIQVDKDGVIIAGHCRRLAALELGMKEVKVQVRSDLNPTQVREFRLAENRVGVSDIDSEMLRAELIAYDDMDLGGIFDDKEIEFMKVDLGDVNEDVFATDMGEVLADQKADIDAKMEKSTAADSRVPLARAFGFRDISAASVIVITNLMARAEAATGKKNDEALTEWAGALT